MGLEYDGLLYGVMYVEWYGVGVSYLFVVCVDVCGVVCIIECCFLHLDVV